MKYDPRINSLDNWILAISYAQYMALARAFEKQAKTFFIQQGAKSEDIMTEVCVMSAKKKLTSGPEFVKDLFRGANNAAAEFRAASHDSDVFPDTKINHDPLGQVTPLLYSEVLMSALNLLVPTQCLVAQISWKNLQLHLDNNKGYMGKRITLVAKGVDANKTGIMDAMRAVSPSMRVRAGVGNAMPFEANFIPKDATTVTSVMPQPA